MSKIFVIGSWIFFVKIELGAINFYFVFLLFLLVMIEILERKITIKIIKYFRTNG